MIVETLAQQLIIQSAFISYVGLVVYSLFLIGAAWLMKKGNDIFYASLLCCMCIILIAFEAVHLHKLKYAPEVYLYEKEMQYEKRYTD